MIPIWRVESEDKYMKVYRFLAFFFIGVFGIFATPIFADLEEIQIEEQLASRLQRYLDGIYGPGHFLARVDVTVSSPRYEVRYTQQSNAKLRETPQEKVNILPGYPVIKNLGPDSLNKLPFDSITTLIRPQIEKISVDVVVENSFPRGQVGRAQQLIKEVLGLKDGRDVIAVSYRPFNETAPATQKIEITQTPQPLFTIQNFFYLASLALLVLFILLYYMLQNKAVMAVRSAKSGGSGDTGLSSNISVNPTFEMPQSGGGAAGDLHISSAPPVKRYFDFISEENIDKLQYIIKSENMGLENLASVVAFLPPHLAAKILSTLDVKALAQIGVALLDQRMMSRAAMDKLEAHIKGAIECLAGGEIRFQQVVSHLSGDLKKSLLSLLSENVPEVYTRIRPHILLFDDIQKLSDDEIKILLSEVRMEVFSIALASVDEATYARIDDNLTKSAKDMISQYLDLRGGSISSEDIQRAQDTILVMLARLDAEGKIQLKSQL